MDDHINLYKATGSKFNRQRSYFIVENESIIMEHNK